MQSLRFKRCFLTCCLSLSLSLMSNNAFTQNAANLTIRLATTTSTENSGLLSHLLPRFEMQSGYNIHVIAVGTGKALRMGRDGDVDVVLVHAPEAEQKFVADGYGDARHAVMYNDFIIVGPKDDPAGLNKTDSIEDAFQRLSNSRQLFVSRGDDSGTHKKELSIWRALAITPAKTTYREAGQSMGKVLQISAELDAYTLTDRGTWLAYKNKLPLKIVFEGDKLLHNPYGIIAVSGNKHPDINSTGAWALIEWIVSPTAQQLISSYRLHGQRLFTPSAGSISTVKFK